MKVIEFQFFVLFYFWNGSFRRVSLKKTIKRKYLFIFQIKYRGKFSLIVQVHLLQGFLLSMSIHKLIRNIESKTICWLCKGENGKIVIASQLSPSRSAALEVIVKLYYELKNRNDHLRYIPRVLHRLTVLNRTNEPLIITQLRSLRITQLFSFTTKNSCLVCLLKLYTLIRSTLRVEVSSSSNYYSCFNKFPRMDLNSQTADWRM